MREVKFIAAIDNKNGLAKDGHIPWDIPTDKKFFRDSISSGPGLMGWNTFASNNFKPFRTCPRNFVVTNQDVQPEGVEIVRDLQKFMQEFTEDLWIIGGGSIFTQLLPQATHLYITRVSGDFECDVFFPAFEDTFELQSESEPQTENNIEFTFQVWVPKRG